MNAGSITTERREMINVTICGLGKMGGKVAEAASKDKELLITSCIESPSNPLVGKEAYGAKVFSSKEFNFGVERADVVIDFTTPESSVENVIAACKNGKNLVIGTTGFSVEQVDTIMHAVRESSVSAVLAPNFSVGVNLFFHFAGLLTEKLRDYDIEIIETHHNAKKDAPSGTALKLSRIVAEKAGISEFAHGRKGMAQRKKEIGMHSIRAGDIVGEHTLLFAGNSERIEFTHKAHSRDCFAAGALLAVKWIRGKRDGKVYGMEEVLGIK